MKKTLSFFALIMMVACLLSCGGEKKQEESKKQPLTFEQKTELNLKKWIAKHAPNPTDFKVVSKETIHNTDSLCIINFTAIAENQFGGHNQLDIQYLNMRLNGVLYEHYDDARNVIPNGLATSSLVSYALEGVLEKKKDTTYLRLLKDDSPSGELYKDVYVLVHNGNFSENTRVIPEYEENEEREIPNDLDLMNYKPSL